METASHHVTGLNLHKARRVGILSPRTKLKLTVSCKGKPVLSAISVLHRLGKVKDKLALRIRHRVVHRRNDALSIDPLQEDLHTWHEDIIAVAGIKTATVLLKDLTLVPLLLTPDTVSTNGRGFRRTRHICRGVVSCISSSILCNSSRHGINHVRYNNRTGRGDGESSTASDEITHTALEAETLESQRRRTARSLGSIKIKLQQKIHS